MDGLPPDAWLPVKNRGSATSVCTPSRSMRARKRGSRRLRSKLVATKDATVPAKSSSSSSPVPDVPLPLASTIESMVLQAFEALTQPTNQEVARVLRQLICQCCLLRPLPLPLSILWLRPPSGALTGLAALVVLRTNCLLHSFPTAISTMMSTPTRTSPRHSRLQSAAVPSKKPWLPTRRSWITSPSAPPVVPASPCITQRRRWMHWLRAWSSATSSLAR